MCVCMCVCVWRGVGPTKHACLMPLLIHPITCEVGHNGMDEPCVRPGLGGGVHVCLCVWLDLDWEWGGGKGRFVTFFLISNNQ
jgi:hypothetical protein